MASVSVIKRRSSWFVRVTGRRGEKERWIRAGATRRDAEKLRAQIVLSSPLLLEKFWEVEGS